MHLSVLLNGKLRGMGRESRCEVLATRHVHAEGDADIYSDLRILSGPPDWPNGDYVAELGVLRARAQRLESLWLIDEILAPE
ncbi:MAG TPA: hypothetical protein VG267_04850 [Terracidiphilus sp.]|jgi:hypothetical protein|nr:hypothetical protein [Terracidiphilus sp.]